jgi:O-antigen ligase
MSFPLAFYVARAEPGWRRWLATLSCLGQILALLLTYSRGAWLGWIAAMFFYGVATRQLKFLIVTLAVTATCVVALPSLRQRVLSVARPRIDPSLSDRLRLAEDAFRLGVDHPILGVGYGRGRLKSALRSRYQGTLSENSLVLHTHNVYIEIFAETGLLGLGTFLALIISTLWRLLHSALTRSAPQRFAGIAIAASWTAAAVAGLGDIPFYHHEPRVFFFTLFALAYLYCRGADTELSPKSLGG